MTAAKVMDIVSRLPGCSGQAADAVSAYTQVKMEDAPTIRHPLVGLLWERQIEKILLQHGWEKVSNWECLFVHREKGLFLSVYVDDIKLAGKTEK